MPSKFIWDNLPGIQLFDNLKLSSFHLVYSCFNYNPYAVCTGLQAPNGNASATGTPIRVSGTNTNNLNCNATELKIYYTGERFLYEINADIIIGFFPDIEYINKKLDSLPDSTKKSILSLPVEIINVLQGYTNTALCEVPMQDIIKTNKEFITIRDQERTMLEYMYEKGIWDPYNLEKNKISIYADLDLSWSRIKFGMKTRFCCFIVSNPNCWQRNNFFDMLTKYKNVDSLGKYKRSLPVDIINIPERSDQDAYYALLSQYKFMITFENNSLAWYNTEKIFNAFQAGVVPIYWGDPLINFVYNPECFIWVKTEPTLLSQYTEFTKAINQIKQLDNDDELYMSMFDKSKNLMIDSAAEDNRLFNAINKIKNMIY